jgi:hypothetical protein
MVNITGSDDALDDGEHVGCGVLGTGSPWQLDNPYGDGPQLVNSDGVLGLVGGTTDISGWTDDVLGKSMNLDFSAAVAGYDLTGYAAGSIAGGGEFASVGFLAGTDPRYGSTGVFGESDKQGVVGVASGANGGGGSSGVLGQAIQSGKDLDPQTGGTGVAGSGYIGVRGETQSGVAILGRVFGPGLAGNFEGDVKVAGNLTVDGDIMLLNKDICERFPSGESECVEGAVMIVKADGTLAPCAVGYDKRVVGVVSGAGTLQPAITLGSEQDPSRSARIALIGTANCLVDAIYGAVDVGDLLTTSETYGHAMKATDQAKSWGAVIGKAIGVLASGKGLVPMVIFLR